MRISREAANMRVILPLPAHPINAPFLLIEPLGFAAKEGLRPSFDFVDSPVDALDSLNVGRHDVLAASAVFAFRCRDQGMPVKAFYSTCRASYRSFAVLAKSSMMCLADLKGKRVGTDHHDLLGLAEPVLREDGVDSNRDISWVTGVLFDVVPKSDESEQIRSGSLDAIWVLACSFEMLRSAGIELRRLPSALDGLSPGECLYALESALEGTAHARLGAFGRCVAQAWNFSRVHPEEATRMVWEHWPECRPKADDEYALRRDAAGLLGRTERGDLHYGRIPLWGSITAEEIELWQDFLLRNGALSQERPAADYFDGSLVQEFNRTPQERVDSSERSA